MNLEASSIANRQHFVEERLMAVGASALVQAALAEMSQPQVRTRQANRRPLIAVVSRQTRETTGKITVEHSAAPVPLLRAIELAGGIGLVVSARSSLDLIPELFGHNNIFDGVILPGTQFSDLDSFWYGEENRHSQNTDRALDRFDMAVALWGTLVRPMPFLSICLGMQAWNVAMGGSLWQDLMKERGSVMPTGKHSLWRPGRNAEHLIYIEPMSQLRQILGMREARTNTLHHQAVKKVGRGLRMVADAPDEVVEALEFDPQWRELMGLEPKFAVGIQSHPEMPASEPASAEALGKIIPAFVNACR